MPDKHKVDYSTDIQWEKIKWNPISKLKFTPAGKHELDFPEDFPILIKFFSFDENFLLTPNYHDYLEIGYVYKGSCILRSNGRDYELNGGDAFIVGNTEFHTIATSGRQQLRLFVLYFMPELIYRAGENDINMDYLKPFLDHSVEFEHKIPSSYYANREIVNMLCKIYIEINKKGNFYKLIIMNTLHDLLLVLVQYYNKHVVNLKDYYEKKANINRLKNVFSLLREHYQEKITIKDAAEAVFMSSSHFCRYFKKVTGLTFTEYLLRVRIDRAKELLLRGQLQVTQVCYEVGFESHSYFDRIFKRFNGITPREFTNRISRPSSIRKNIS